MEQQIKEVFGVIAIALEIFSGFVILVAAVYSVYNYFAGFVSAVKSPVSLDIVRLRLGKTLSFSLEFLIAADILKTLITPTLREISILRAIIAIRIALNFFLEREIEYLAKPGGK